MSRTDCPGDAAYLLIRTVLRDDVDALRVTPATTTGPTSTTETVVPPTTTAVLPKPSPPPLPGAASGPTTPPSDTATGVWASVEAPSAS